MIISLKNNRNYFINIKGRDNDGYDRYGYDAQEYNRQGYDK